MKAVLVEDHLALAEMTLAILRAHTRISDCCIYSTFAEARTGILGSHPDLVVLDNRLGAESGLELARLIIPQLPNTRWLLYSGYTSSQVLREAEALGICATIAKRSPLNSLIGGVCAALAGNHFRCSITAQEMLRVHCEKHILLTDTERKIGICISDGLQPKEIAAMVGISYKTVLNCIVTIRKKTNAESMVEIADYFRGIGR